ncbi:unnamed protein product [Closterium sp. Naga37s-1]|nr:unnamed protein product [Closterium sp. Naga37s-1]
MEPYFSSCREILIAVDNSEGSELAFNWALRNYCKRHDHVRLIHVVRNYSDAIGTLPKEAIACLEQQAMTSARAVVEKYMRRCAHADVDCDWRIACGDERDVICREVMRVCADVLIVGTRSLPAAKKALLGSVSEYCAHHSACPVIIVRPKELKSEVIAAQRSVVSEALPQGC